MRLNILAQIIDHYHKFVMYNSAEFRNDFQVHPTEVEEPMNGIDGVTEYDEKDIDEDWYA